MAFFTKDSKTASAQLWLFYKKNVQKFPIRTVIDPHTPTHPPTHTHTHPDTHYYTHAQFTHTHTHQTCNRIYWLMNTDR